eukprot:CAMPEP_0114527594 /NCGR_PEP_ID=MMETSP0109-20121206/23710_1 /TAXON_ID=29199 /ORGANISM="Chlorarachnion reptans, Strain CCCM449" /LENGTH=82 /DNA_ID=CAMNT_0001709591 /DNA_START=400 /DNA_END=645 /DNA_ORIENTATION=-
MIFDEVTPLLDDANVTPLPDDANLTWDKDAHFTGSKDATVTARVLFYSLVRQQSDPDTVLTRIDGLAFQAEWHHGNGLVGEW